MNLLALGLCIFLGVHLFSRARHARADLIRRLGEKPYKAIYSLIALLGLALIVWGMARAPREPLWAPLSTGRTWTILLMPLAIISISASNMPTNLKRLTAHPMLWGITLWALLHLLAVSHGAGVVLFSSLALYSLFAMAAQTRQGVRPHGVGVPVQKDITVALVGLAITGALFLAHGWLFGVSL